ncbi:hypothetical protein SBY92_005073 [Candida maltosa Xu316]
MKIQHNKRKLNELEDISNINKKSRIVSFKEKPLTRSNVKFNLNPTISNNNNNNITNNNITINKKNKNNHHQHHRHQQQQHFITPPSPPQQRSSPPAICLDDDNDNIDDDSTTHQHPPPLSFPATPPESIINDDSTTPITGATEDYSTTNNDLNTNVDYITLTSSLRMAMLKSNQIKEEIVQLSKLQNYYLSNDNKEETIDFFIKLMNNELNLPKPNKIIKCPIINWSNYHPSLSQITKDFETQIKNGDKKEEAKNSLYKALQLFDK